MWPALYELHLSSSREPRHAALMAKLFDLESSLYAEVIDEGVAAGVFTTVDATDRIAATAVTLEDGCGLHLVGRNANVDPAWGRTTMLNFLATALGCPQLRADPTPAE